MNSIINFNKYLIMVGIRSHEFTYTDDVLFANVWYFKKCYDENLSAYKALLFLHDDLEYRKKHILETKI